VIPSSPTDPAALSFEKVAILCYRLHDIADEIDLAHAGRLLTEGPRPVTLTREGSEYIELPQPPLSFGIGTREIRAGDRTLTLDVEVRLFEFGAASLQFGLEAPTGSTTQDLVTLTDLLDEAPALDALVAELIRGLTTRLGPALRGAHLWEQSERYTVYFAESIRGNPSAEHLLAHLDLPRLLLGEPDHVSLSKAEQESVTGAHYSYTRDDLAVIDWSAAFVYEPSGSRDLLLLIELVNAQLLELRYYDELLDTRLNETYDQMEVRNRGWWLLFRSPYRRLARRTALTLIELSEFIERAENSIKLIGDVYLAKVYVAAAQQLRIPDWQRSVTRKHELLARTHGLLKGEVDTDRSITLEATIVALIVFEIVMAFAKVMG
jgi:hypothetical protein